MEESEQKRKQTNYDAQIYSILQLPGDIQTYICTFNRETFSKYHVLSKKAATNTHYDENLNRRGVWIRWYNNGSLRSKTMLFKGKRQGETKKWHKKPNRQLYLQAWYSDDTRHGKYQRWYKDGQIQILCKFVHGKTNGENKSWHENGQPHVQVTYVDGKRQGDLLVWYKNGQLKAKKKMKDNKIHGEAKEWYDVGRLKIQSVYNKGKKNGEYKEWYESGLLRSQSRWVDGKIWHWATRPSNYKNLSSW